MFIERGSVMDELTNETKFVLQTLYKEYLDRLKKARDEENGV